MKVGLNQWVFESYHYGRVGNVCADISENSCIRSTQEGYCADVGDGKNPVVVNSLVSIQYEGVTLTGEYLNGIDNERRDVDTIHLDYRLEKKHILLLT